MMVDIAEFLVMKQLTTQPSPVTSLQILYIENFYIYYCQLIFKINCVLRRIKIVNETKTCNSHNVKILNIAVATHL